MTGTTTDAGAQRERFHEILDGIDLSSTAQGKFHKAGFNRLIADLLGVGEDDIYVSGTRSPKVFNILNRLAQGKALIRRHTLGVVVLGDVSAVREGIRYASTLVGDDKRFDSIAIVSGDQDGWRVFAVVERAGGSATQQLQNLFPNLEHVLPESDDANSDVEAEAPELKYEIDALDADDPIMQRVSELLEDGFGGIVFRGPPGTSKTWYAARVAATITGGDETRIRTVQFHPSYQYEDFVEGFIPRKSGGFALVRKHLMLACEQAAEQEPNPVVLVIDEISRVDPARVLGEALTYIEASKRGIPFRLASGRPASIPHNIIVLATMNVFDRGVEQVEAALERRLAFIELQPDVDLLKTILTRNGLADDQGLRGGIVQFFQWAQSQRNPYCKIGHAYFNSVVDEASLKRLWDHQLRFVFERAYPTSQEEGMRDAERAWAKIFNTGIDDTLPAGGTPVADTAPVALPAASVE
jgi:5-methylcytosine-specific restriction enzyme B